MLFGVFLAHNKLVVLLVLKSDDLSYSRYLNMADFAEKKIHAEEEKLRMDAIDPAAAPRRALMESITQQGPCASKGLPLGFRGSEVPPGNQFKIQFAAYWRVVQGDLNAMEVHCNKDL